MLKDLNCPNCGAPGLEPQQPDGVVVCKFCGHKYTETDEVICPRCETLNPPQVLFCQKCGEKLKRPCAACSAENWAGAEYCAACGRDLDTISTMANRTRDGYAEHLNQQRRDAPAIKSEQEAQSQKRLAGMWELDRQRTEELKAQLDRQRAQNKILMSTMFVVGAIFLCIILVGVGLVSMFR